MFINRFLRVVFEKSPISVVKKHANRNMVFIFTGNFLTILINILTVKLLTNKFTTSEFGVYSFIISFSSLPQLVLFAPISSAIFPFINHKKDSGTYLEFQKDIFQIFTFVSCFLLILSTVLFSANILSSFFSYELLIASFVALVFAITLSWLSMLDTFSLSNLKIKEYTLFPIINLVLKVLVVIIFFYIKVLPVSIILLFSCIHILLFWFEFNYLVRKKIINHINSLFSKNIFEFKSPGKKEIYNYSKNFFLWGLFSWCQTFFDKWFLQNYIGISSVAVYSVYYQYGFFPFSIFSSIVSQYITPIYFSKVSKVDLLYSFQDKLLKYTFVLVVFVCVGMSILAYFIAPFFIRLFTNENYLTYITYFPLIVVAGCFFGFGQIIIIPLLGAENVSKIRFPKIVTSLLSILLFWILIPKFGFKGILFSLLIGNSFYFFTLLVINYLQLNKLKDQKNLIQFNE